VVPAPGDWPHKEFNQRCHQGGFALAAGSTREQGGDLGKDELPGTSADPEKISAGQTLSPAARLPDRSPLPGRVSPKFVIPEVVSALFPVLLS